MEKTKNEKIKELYDKLSDDDKWRVNLYVFEVCSKIMKEKLKEGDDNEN